MSREVSGHPGEDVAHDRRNPIRFFSAFSLWGEPLPLRCALALDTESSESRPAVGAVGQAYEKRSKKRA